jgi:hypothetical protein
MARTTAAALERFLEWLREPGGGLDAQLRAIAARDRTVLAPVSAKNLAMKRGTPEMVERVRTAEYPQLLVYAEQTENEQREKFAAFSGTIRLAAEVRITSEALDGLEAAIHRYVEAAVRVLSSAPGEWLAGLVYTGKYTVTYAAARAGGENYLQSAKVSFVLQQFVAAE